MEVKRIFAAIEIIPTKNLITEFDYIRRKLFDSNINWVNLNGIHITLKFFGETEISQIEKINNILVEIAQKNRSFCLEIKNLGVFKNLNSPKVLWFGLEPSNELANLYKDIENAIKPLGYKPDYELFQPHLTIGRIRSLKSDKELKLLINEFSNKSLQNQTINCFHLYESNLQPKGSVYSKISGYSLSGNLS